MKTSIRSPLYLGFHFIRGPLSKVLSIRVVPSIDGPVSSIWGFSPSGFRGSVKFLRHVFLTKQGTGHTQTSVSDYLLSMKVVNSKGEIQTIPDPCLPEDEKTEILKAARVSLGTFGVIIEMTLSIPDMKIVDVQNRFDLTLGEVFDDLESQLTKYLSVHIVWIPFNSLPLTKAFEEVIFPKSIESWDPWKDDIFLHTYETSTKGKEPQP